MHISTINTLRAGLVIAAIVCELLLSNGMMILVLAVVGIAGRVLVMYQEELARRQAEQEGKHKGIDLAIAALSHPTPRPACGLHSRSQGQTQDDAR